MLKTVFNQLQKKTGFVSLETIVVTGAVIALATYALYHYKVAGTVSVDFSIDKVKEVIVQLP